MDGSHCKETTEDYVALDIREIKRHGLIDTEEMPEELPGVARIEWISSGFGGGEGHYLRPWFRCPGEKCGRRVAILYERKDPDEHPRWACRKCLDLCYPVELEDRVGRLIRKSAKARVKLGDGHAKPKGMHHETYVKLGIEYLQIQRELSEALQERTVLLLETMERERIKFDL
jgi:hypothetical protein